MHYCIIAKDCEKCPLDTCPCEKLEPFWLDFIEDDEDKESEEECE